MQEILLTSFNVIALGGNQNPSLEMQTDDSTDEENDKSLAVKASNFYSLVRSE